MDDPLDASPGRQRDLSPAGQRNDFAAAAVLMGLLGLLLHSDAAAGLVLGVLGLATGAAGLSTAVRIDRGLAASVTGLLLSVATLAATVFSLGES